MSENLIQFYLKCQNVKTGALVTYRFAHQDELLQFSRSLAAHNLVIVDSHIGFYDIELLFNPFDCENSAINSGELNTASSFFTDHKPSI